MVGFIGAGNMAGAIISSMAASHDFKDENIAVFDLDIAKTAALSNKYGVQVLSSENEIASTCNTVVLAVKPNVFPSLLPKIKATLKHSNPLIISIAAGKTIEYIESLLEYNARIVRVMPNINATVSAAVSAYCPNTFALSQDENFAQKFCSSFGLAIKLPQEHFPIFGVIGGCSPAFAYIFIDSLARAAVKNGLAKDKALQISAQAVLGSAKMILETGCHPWELTDKVCSPGGTTIEGVLSLQKDGFEAAVANAVNAATEKDKKI